MSFAGHVFDMIRRSKENRQHLKNLRNRTKDSKSNYKSPVPDISVEEFEEIRRQTKEKEERDGRYFRKMMFIVITASLLILLFLAIIFLTACNGKAYTEQKKRMEIVLKNEKAWLAAVEFRDSVTDSVFLQTKRPMSDDAIGAIWPYSYETGLYEDRAYNKMVYIIALKRVIKRLTVEDNQFICELKTGAEVNIAEDIYEYILINVIKHWNQGVKEGHYKIIIDKEGHYSIQPTPK